MILRLRPGDCRPARPARRRDQRTFPPLSTLIALVWIFTASLVSAQTRPAVQWIRGGHTTLKQLVISADGNYMATCGAEGTFKIHRLSDGVVTVTGSGHTNQVSSIALSPDGTRAITGSMDSTIKIWDLSTGTPIRTIVANGWVDAVAWSPDGAKVATTFGDNTIHVYNASDGSVVSVMTGHTDKITSIRFSGDSTRLVSGSWDKSARIWQISTGTQLQLLNSHTNFVECVAFSPDSTTVCTSSDDATVKIWNAATGALLFTKSDAFGVVNTICISPDSKYVAGGGFDAKMRLWRISDGALLNTSTTGAWFTCSSFSADGSKIYMAPDNGVTFTYTGTTGNYIGILPIEHTGTVYNAVISPTRDTVATASYDTTTKIYDFNTGVLLQTLQNGNQPMEAVTYSPDGKYVANVGNDSRVRIWNVSTGALVLTVSNSPLGLSLAWTPTGSVIVGNNDNTIKIFRAQDGVSQGSLSGHTGPVNSLALSPDGALLASASTDKTIKIWRLSDQSLVRTLTAHTDAVRNVQFSSDGTMLISAGNDKTSILWSVADGSQIQTFHHTDNVVSAAVAPDGKTAATGGEDKHLKIWRISDGVLLQDYTQETGTYALGFNQGVDGLNYSQDGRVIMCARGDAGLCQIANPYWSPTLTGLAMNPAAVAGGNSATGTITLNAAAPTGGTVITLGSNNSAASVPATVIVPAGATTVDFTVSTGSVATDTTVAISAGLNGTVLSANLVVAAPVALSLSIAPNSVRGGQGATGTVTLNGTAPAGGISVALSGSNTVAAGVPNSVLVAAGSNKATFPVTTSVVAAVTPVTLTAIRGSAATATLTVTPPVITGLSVSPTSVRGGQNSTGAVTLSDAAPTGGITVTLSSSAATLAAGPASVTVAAGATTANFTITTHGVPTSTVVNLTATLGSSSNSAALTLTPPDPAGLSLSPTSVKGGQNSTGAVTLSDPAGPAGIVVTLSSNNSAATVPASVTVASGAKTATFTVSTSAVSNDTPVTLTGGFNGQTQTATLTVQAPLLISFALQPTVVRSLQNSTGTLILDGPAPVGGISINLFSANGSIATLPAGVLVPAGATKVTVPVTTYAVSADTRVLLAATLGTSNQSVTLTVQPHLPFDFNNDGYNDILFQNQASNLVVIWYVNALNVLGGDSVPYTPPAGWQVVGCGDINQDGNPDLFLQNQTTGKINVWYLKGNALIGGEELSQSPANGYKVVGIGDFNGDGKPDILFQNQSTNQLAIWFLDGAKVTGGISIPQTPVAGYSVVGVGDINGDGKPDILFQNQTSNRVVVWFMNGSVFTGNGGETSSVPLTGWLVKGVEDLNGDGKADLVFQNQNTNQVAVWFMDGLNVPGGGAMNITPDAGYKLRGPH